MDRAFGEVSEADNMIRSMYKIHQVEKETNMDVFYIGVGGIRDEEKQYSCLFAGLRGGGILRAKTGFAHVG